MPRDISWTKWSAPVSDVEKRLKQLDGVLHGAQRADGSVDLVKAKALAGTDRSLSLLVNAARVDPNATTLTPAQAKAEFLELQRALKLARSSDTNGDGKLNFDETWNFDEDPKLQYPSKPASPAPTAEGVQARRLVLRAAEPVDVIFGNARPSKETNSLKARQETERRITELAEFHAETPEGAEALKWAMRRVLVVEGWGNFRGSPVFDLVGSAETNWKAWLPIFGKQYREGRGHLSNAELEARLGPLKAYSEKISREINGRLLMDYRDGFLAGKDLP